MCLKLSHSPVFREMLSLPTRGGPIQLPETAKAIHVALDAVTGAEKAKGREFTTVVSAFELAKRFDMKGPMS